MICPPLSSVLSSHVWISNGGLDTDVLLCVLLVILVSYLCSGACMCYELCLAWHARMESAYEQLFCLAKKRNKNKIK